MFIAQLAAMVPALSGISTTSSLNELSSDFAENATILIPSHRPSYAAALDPRLVSFSIEADRWPDWAGSEVGKPNVFTQQLFANLQDLTGVPPAVRVGADSEDRTHLDSTLNVGHAVYPPSTPEFPHPEAAVIAIGRHWYDLSRNFAPQTPFTWGLNLKSLNVSETQMQARHLAKSFAKHDHTSLWLEAVEIGNEPELYVRSESGGGVKNPGDWTQWSVKNYTATWTKYASVAHEELTSAMKTVLRVGDIQLGEPASGWCPQSLIQAGLFDNPFNKEHVKIYSEHLYQAGFVPGAEAKSGELMNKRYIRGNLTLRAGNIAAAHGEGLRYVLGESNSYSGHGSPGTSNAAEAALWAIDYLLQAASLGVSRVYLSHGVGYLYSSFQPIRGMRDDGRGLDRPHILPLYYGLLLVNEAIGQSSSDRYIAELHNIHPNVVAYGVYEGFELKRIVLVNSQVYNCRGPRRVVTINLDGLGSNATAKRLTVPHSSANHGLLWGDQDYDGPSGTASGVLHSQPVNGSVISLEASSAVLITL